MAPRKSVPNQDPKPSKLKKLVNRYGAAASSANRKRIAKRNYKDRMAVK